MAFYHTMDQEYSLVDKAKTAISYTLMAAAFAGFCAMYGNAMTAGRDNCSIVRLDPGILVCDDKKEPATQQRVSTASRNIDEVLTE